MKKHYRTAIKELDRITKDIETLADEIGYDIDNNTIYQLAISNITAVDMNLTEDNKALSLIWAGYYLGQLDYRLAVMIKEREQ